MNLWWQDKRNELFLNDFYSAIIAKFGIGCFYFSSASYCGNYAAADAANDDEDDEGRNWVHRRFIEGEHNEFTGRPRILSASMRLYLEFIPKFLTAIWVNVPLNFKFLQLVIFEITLNFHRSMSVFCRGAIIM